MTDIFFSYRSPDRERVRPVRDALAALGFDVFWDQQVPPGVDWDTWIRRHLAQAKCAIVFWSVSSVESPNVIQEATIASQQGKLIPVLLAPLTAEQFPMGLYTQQAANLINWNGDFEYTEWRKLCREIESKLTPSWVRQRIDELEVELVAERARREVVERRDKVLQSQIGKEVEAQQELKRERDKAVDEAAAFRVTVQELNRAISERASDTKNKLQASKRARDEALARAVEAERKLRDLDELRNALHVGKNQDIASATGSGTQIGGLSEVKAALTKLQETWARRGLVISAVAVVAVIVIGLWIYQVASVSWPISGARPDSAGESNLKPASAPAVDDRARPAPGAERDAKTTADPFMEVQAIIHPFTIATGMVAFGKYLNTVFDVPSMAHCQSRCTEIDECGVFSYSKNKYCYLHRPGATLRPSGEHDSGTRK